MELIYTVTLPYDPVWSALDWAKINCPSYVSNRQKFNSDSQYHYHEHFIEYVFNDESDAVIFALKWA